MGEDAFLLAAQGYEVTLYEQNPVIAALLKDAIRRAKKNYRSERHCQSYESDRRKQCGMYVKTS